MVEKPTTVALSTDRTLLNDTRGLKHETKMLQFVKLVSWPKAELSTLSFCFDTSLRVHFLSVETTECEQVFRANDGNGTDLVSTAAWFYLVNQFLEYYEIVIARLNNIHFSIVRLGSVVQKPSLHSPCTAKLCWSTQQGMNQNFGTQLVLQVE